MLPTAWQVRVRIFIVLVLPLFIPASVLSGCMHPQPGGDVPLWPCGRAPVFCFGPRFDSAFGDSGLMSFCLVHMCIRQICWFLGAIFRIYRLFLNSYACTGDNDSSNNLSVATY